MPLPYPEAKSIRASYWFYLLNISKACPVLTISMPPPEYKPPLCLSTIITGLLAAIFATTLALPQSTLYTVVRFSQHVIFKCSNMQKSWNDFTVSTYTYHLNLTSTASYTFSSLSICTSSKCSFKKCTSDHALEPSVAFHCPENKIQILARGLPSPVWDGCFLLSSSPRAMPLSSPLLFSHAVHFSASQSCQPLLHLVAFAKESACLFSSSVWFPFIVQVLERYLLRETSPDPLLPD